MLKKLSILTLLLLALLISPYIDGNFLRKKMSGAPPYGAPEEEAPKSLDPYAKYRNWKRPDVPPKVGIQIGHLNSEKLPEELEKIRGATGASGGGYTEAEVNEEIARDIASRLESQGITVDIIPATVPPEYWADIFISIHADGSVDPYKSGYKFAAPWRDFKGKADSLVSVLEKEYESATGLARDPNVTRNMRGYYAFAWWRYVHSIHPMTTAVIAETGFLTNWGDRQMLVNTPQIPANAISRAIVKHLKNEGLL